MSNLALVYFPGNSRAKICAFFQKFAAFFACVSEKSPLDFALGNHRPNKKDSSMGRSQPKGEVFRQNFLCSFNKLLVFSPINFTCGHESGRIKPAPNRGYHFVSHSPPFFLGGLGPFPVPANPFSVGVLLLLQGCMHPLLSSTRR